MFLNRIAFFPYSPNGTDYIVTMQRILQTQYEVVDYMHLKYGVLSIEEIGCIYLNWLEDYFDESDKELLLEANRRNVRVVWVFHNKTSHDRKDNSIAIANISFIANIADSIILHSKNSGHILASMCDLPYEKIGKKLAFIPHPNYIGDYKSFSYPSKQLPNVDNNKYTYLFVGQMRPYKNLEILISVYKEIREKTDSQLILAGRFLKSEYYKAIKEMCFECQDIKFYPYYISSFEMEGILELADVLVLPYNIESSLNSGSMIMAFSYKKTVIVPDICMADDFSDDLIFKYHYENEKEHKEQLLDIMMNAYNMGHIEAKRRGDALFEVIKDSNSEDRIKRCLIELCNNKGNSADG